jgi:exodeoxyribonuclease VII small subunit
MASKSASTPATPAAPAFEAALAQLESLVGRLESGDLPLDEALRTFEQGVRLTRECQTALAAAQQKVQQLLQRGDTVAVEDVDATATLETQSSDCAFSTACVATQHSARELSSRQDRATRPTPYCPQSTRNAAVRH